MNKFPVHDKSTVERCERALQHAIEGAVDAARRLDQERQYIGMPPAEPLFVLVSQLPEVIAAIDAERAKAARAKLSAFELDRLEHEEARAEAAKAAANAAHYRACVQAAAELAKREREREDEEHRAELMLRSPNGSARKASCNDDPRGIRRLACRHAREEPRGQGRRDPQPINSCRAPRAAAG